MPAQGSEFTSEEQKPGRWVKAASPLPFPDCRAALPVGRMLEDTPELAFQRRKSGEKRGMSHWPEVGALIRARAEDEAIAN